LTCCSGKASFFAALLQPVGLLLLNAIFSRISGAFGGVT
jgi:hypothetical protein